MSAAGSTGLTELLQEVRRIEISSSQLASDLLSGGFRSVFRGSGVEFEEVREYAEGDDPRTVDWSVTARMGRPYVRKYKEERQRTFVFLFDLSASMEGGFGALSARETATRVAATLALAAVRGDDRVGLLAFGSALERFVPPGKGLPHALRILRDCLALPSHPGPASLGRALEHATRVLRRRTILFVMSDFLADGWEAPLALCAQKHDVIAVRLILPEFDPPQAEPMRLRDPESDLRAIVAWQDEGSRAAYRQRVADWNERTSFSLRRAGVECMNVPVPLERNRDAITKPILDFFSRRARREQGG
jgi:uncharacterized protein (DUF58 family)